MNVKVTVKLDNKKISSLIESSKQALEQTGDSLLTDIRNSAVVPKDTGELERSSFVDTTGINWGHIRIMFDTPYARRLYWHPEYDFRDDKNVNAQGKWMESYINGEKQDFMKNAYLEHWKNFSKGLIH